MDRDSMNVSVLEAFAASFGQAVAHISPDELLSYMACHGWTPSYTAAGRRFQSWVLLKAGAVMGEALVPMPGAFDREDLARHMTEAVQAVFVAEGWPVYIRFGIGFPHDLAPKRRSEHEG